MRKRNDVAKDRAIVMGQSFGGTIAIWIYTENDRYWGAKLPKVWFDAFKAAGGVGDIVRLAVSR